MTVSIIKTFRNILSGEYNKYLKRYALAFFVLPMVSFWWLTTHIISKLSGIYVFAACFYYAEFCIAYILLLYIFNFFILGNKISTNNHFSKISGIFLIVIQFVFPILLILSYVTASAQDKNSLIFYFLLILLLIILLLAAFIRTIYLNLSSNNNLNRFKEMLRYIFKYIVFICFIDCATIVGLFFIICFTRGEFPGNLIFFFALLLMLLEYFIRIDLTVQLIELLDVGTKSNDKNVIKC